MELKCRHDEGVREGQTGELYETTGSEFVQGISPAMRSVEAVMHEVAQSEAPVLLLAERGTGKKTLARRIHDQSPRSGEPFCMIRCAGLDSGKFGESRVQAAGTGTVYLEEVGDLSAEGQSLLLRELTEENSSQRGFRVICGSARDLETEVRTGKLREDLYYRISGVCLRLPPLRQRRDDIIPLTEYFLQKHARDFNRQVPRLSDETCRLFHEYSWPGNVAELENAARAILALGDEGVAMRGLRSMLLQPDVDGNGGRVSLKEAARAASREAEKEIILRALTRTRWNRRRAAQDLQISYKALLYKLKQMGCSEFGASQGEGVHEAGN
jgi:two-component system, NtrC family, response regulator AtoC